MFGVSNADNVVILANKRPLAEHRHCGYGGGNVIKLVVPQYQLLPSTMKWGLSKGVVFKYSIA